MKASDLRRALLILFALCGIVMVYFYCQQPGRPNIRPATKFLGDTKMKHMYTDVRWTWKCSNEHCERFLASNNERRTSLATCNMVCGPTQLWPLPSGPMKLGNRAVSFFQHQIHVVTDAEEPARSLLEQSYASFNDSIGEFLHKSNEWIQKSDVDKFLIRVSVLHSHEVKLYVRTDEAYNLTIHLKDDNLVAEIRAKTFFGARHGLETLTQLIWWDEFESGGMLKTLSNVTICDAPMFPYRGLMLDTSRNFMSIAGIKHVIDGMAANKLNVFHWHVSDSQSFPLELPRVPQLSKYGAYEPALTYGVKDVKDLVEYSRVRGVRIVIEVDTPAHAGNGWLWGPEEGLGDLAVCVNAQPWNIYCGEPPCGQLNPENPQVYDVLEKVYKDILELTGEDEIFHIGGDEVNLECWEEYLYKNVTPSNYTDLHSLWGEFTLKILHRLERANGGRKPKYIIVWSSNLSKRPYNIKYLNKDDVVIQSWGASDWTETRELLSDGYQVILSHVNAWYLDCGFGRWRERGEAACDPYRTWQTVYLHQPWLYDRVYQKHMLGAEACLWSEQLDEVSLDARLWPRASAFAERIWTDPKVDVDSYSIHENVYTRLVAHRQRMIDRGFNVEAMWPLWCTQNPGMCL